MTLRIALIAMFAMISMAQGAWATSARTAANAPKDVACRKAYAPFHEKGSIKIKIVFGYKDTRPGRFVGDRHERLAFVQRILKPCRDGRQDCGFARDFENADLFRKVVTGIDDLPLKVTLIVAHSSVGSDDVANREDPFQKWQSAYAQHVFLNGIEKSDIVFYNGHSRFGGGPDFEPPRLISSSEVDSETYRSQKPGLRALREKLTARAKNKVADTGLKVLGLFSCTSSQHFTQDIALNSKAGFISSPAVIYYADALEHTHAALSALLEGRCEKDFQAALKPGPSSRGSRLQGFF